MTANASLKSLARKSGLFGLARKVYRSISPAVRRHLSDDRALYGKFISRGDLVFDIGCNLGQKSVTFLRLGARVIALEPNPNCAPVLDLEFGDEPPAEICLPDKPLLEIEDNAVQKAIQDAPYITYKRYHLAHESWRLGIVYSLTPPTVGDIQILSAYRAGHEARPHLV